jgi:hypothetical protein
MAAAGVWAALDLNAGSAAAHAPAPAVCCIDWFGLVVSFLLGVEKQRLVITRSATCTAGHHPGPLQAAAAPLKMAAAGVWAALHPDSGSAAAPPAVFCIVWCGGVLFALVERQISVIACCQHAQHVRMQGLLQAAAAPQRRLLRARELLLVWFSSTAAAHAPAPAINCNSLCCLVWLDGVLFVGCREAAI